MDTLDFSEEEIQEQLAVLGYRNIPKHRLREFKQDLDQLIQQEKLKILDSSSDLNISSRSPLAGGHTTTSPPAYTKETVPQCFPSQPGHGFFLHPGTADNNREVLSSWRLNREPDHQDSYARCTVAPRTLPPSKTPHRLHVLLDPGPPNPGPPDPGPPDLGLSDPGPLDTSSDCLPTSQASSPEGGGRAKHFITRKVLRKYKGQVFICDESVHSEDSAARYRTIWTAQPRPAPLPGAMYELCPADEESSGNDRSPLHSSFWSDGEEQQEVVEGAGHEEGPAAAAGGGRAPLNPKDTSALPPPPGQQEHTGDASHGREADLGAGDEDDGGSEEDDWGGDEEDDWGGDEGDDWGSDEDGAGDEEDGVGDEGDGGEGVCSVDNEEDEGARNDEDDDDDVRGNDDSNAEPNGEPDSEPDGEPDSEPDGEPDSGPDGEGDGSKVQAGGSGSPALSRVTSGYGTYRPDSAGRDTEAGTIAEFDGETLVGDESDEEDLHRFYCDEPSPPPRPWPPLPPPRSPDPREAEEEERGGGGVDRTCPAPDRGPSEERGEDPALPQAGGGGRFPWASADQQRHVSALGERWTDSRDLLVVQVEEELRPEEELEEFCSNTDIRFIDSQLEPGCAGATWDHLRPREPDVSGLEERLGGLRMSPPSAHRHGDDIDEETENEGAAERSEGGSSLSDGCSSEGLSLTAFESFVRDMVRMQNEGALKPRPKSFIRPRQGHPHTRNLKKMDPVARYFQYKQEWDMFKVPGEKDRRALHWEIREQLAYQAPPARPRRAYVPNSYVVPTEKKRSALRWEVRNDLASGLLPQKHNFRF